MKEYFFIDDSWTYSACDCCPPTEMECYNINLDEHPDFVQNGSAHSIEDCAREVLMYEGFVDEEDDLNSKKIFDLLVKHEIHITIEY